jgi:hypothetical protein
MKRLYAQTKTESIKKSRVEQNPQEFEGVSLKVKKNLGGRPPKYLEARRPITVTLPERILQDLHSINPDRSKAIVKCVEAIVALGDRPFKPVELIELTPGKALILVGHSSSLQQIEWLRLVEIAPFRYLLVLPSGTAVEVLEVTIQDLIRDLDPNSSESVMLKELLNVINHQRRGRSITKAELLFVDITGSVNSRIS